MTRRRSRRSQQRSTAKQGLLSNMSNDQIIIGAVVVVAVLAVAFLAFTMLSNQEREIGGVQRILNDDTVKRSHVDNATYTTQRGLPPAGGNHDQVWQNCGVYDTVINDANAVHSLEHGAVWITYNDSLSADEIETLRNITRDGDFRLLSPRPQQESPIALTAWTYQLEVDSVDDSRIEDFIHNYEQGPQTPEPGATCSRGIGNPL
jgi:hypothetical protein